jgi:hypothetical protein
MVIIGLLSVPMQDARVRTPHKTLSWEFQTLQITCTCVNYDAADSGVG